MAGLFQDKASGFYRIQFRYGGRQFNKSLKTRDEREAESIRGRVDEILGLLKRGRLTIPDGADVGLFILSDGKLTAKPVAEVLQVTTAPTLGAMVNTYLANPPANKEPGTIKVEGSYLKNVVRIMGESTPLDAIDLQAARTFARKRLAEKRGGGKPPKPYTVEKELKTLIHVWRWSVKLGTITTTPTWKYGDVDLPKEEESGEWMPYTDIIAKVERNGLSERETAALWNRLFLTDADLADLLTHVQRQPTDPWVYPAIVFAALTGARRSEVLRSERDDFDLAGGRVVIREKKRDKRKSITTRSVDIHPRLAETMTEWLAKHPGGRYTLARDDGKPLDVDVMDNRLETVLRGSKWTVIRGWHVFRHSFISILASNAVDQRVIDSFVGHQTEEMRRRYRHLFPKTKRSAILTLLPG